MKTGDWIICIVVLVGAIALPIKMLAGRPPAKLECGCPIACWCASIPCCSPAECRCGESPIERQIDRVLDWRER